MKKILVVAVLVLGFASVSHAANPPDCALSNNLTIAALNLQGGCTLNNLLVLSGFAIQGTNGSNPTVNFTGAGAFGFQVNWNPGLGTNPGPGNQDIQFEYEVTGINGASVSSVSLHSSGTSGTSIQEVVCQMQGTLGGGCTGTVYANWVQTGAGDSSRPLVPGPQSTFWAWKDINITPGNAISGFGQDFTVPEPGTLTMLGTGLLGLAGLVRRKFRA